MQGPCVLWIGIIFLAVQRLKACSMVSSDPNSYTCSNVPACCEGYKAMGGTANQIQCVPQFWSTAVYVVQCDKLSKKAQPVTVAAAQAAAATAAAEAQTAKEKDTPSTGMQLLILAVVLCICAMLCCAAVVCCWICLRSDKEVSRNYSPVRVTEPMPFMNWQPQAEQGGPWPQQDQAEPSGTRDLVPKPHPSEVIPRPTLQQPVEKVKYEAGEEFPWHMPMGEAEFDKRAGLTIN